MKTLIDELLQEQSMLQTPAARFSEIHQRLPSTASTHRQLIPLHKPAAGEQYAFEVSLDRCTGCKACVSACHSLNGLDENEAWRDTGLLLGGTAAPAWQQTVTTACHHCEDPGCLNGCPVGAYEKDQETGIVRHLDDQCIGCSYCILKCPYDVPKYSKKRGIVRKCDMCHQRLAQGEAPACVQACPTEAISIVKVETNQKKLYHATLFADGTASASSALPRSSITLPTTVYRGRSVPSTAYAADRAALIPQHAHWPLVLMLTLTQAGVGLGSVGMIPIAPSTIIAYIAALIFYAGMCASVFHLGQPLKAWRFFLGLKTSWLSREILAFSLFAPIPVVICALPLIPDFPFKALISQLTALSAFPLGLVAVFTSVMIYHDTQRAIWIWPRTMMRFFGTVTSFLSLGYAITTASTNSIAIFCIICIAKLATEIIFLRHRNEPNWTPNQHSARLQLGPLRKIFIARVTCTLVAMATAFIQPWATLPFLLGAEILERLLFFQSVQAPKMPGIAGHNHSHH